jgi:hypothetical protein
VNAPILTRMCCVCDKVLEQGPPGAPVSHGIGPECWDAYRQKLGLPHRPYPVPYGPPRTAA